MNKNDRHYLNGPAGVLAIDQGDWQYSDGVDATVTAWTFMDIDVNGSVTATVDSSGNWNSQQRRFAREGKVIQTNEVNPPAQ